MRQPASTRIVRQHTGVHRSRGRSDHRRRSTPAAAFRQDRRSAATTARNRTAPAVPDPILLGAGTWLACGIVLLGLTPWPLRDAQLGWSFTFWALAAPLVVLLVHCIRRCNPWRGE